MIESQLFLQAVTRAECYLETSIFFPGDSKHTGESGEGSPSWKCQMLLWPVSHGNLFRLPRIEQAVFSVCRAEINTTLHLLPQPSPQVIFIILHCGCSFFKTVKRKCSPVLAKAEPQTERALTGRGGSQEGADLTSKCRCLGMGV